MQAYELQSNSGFAALVRTERPSPPLGPRGVRIGVRAVSLNYRDLIMLRRANAGELPQPIIPASDGAGEVMEVGAEVTRVAPGDRVMGNFFPTWIDGPLSDAHHAAALGGGRSDGMLAEQVVLHEEALVAIPDYLSFEEAATLPCAAVTAWNALFEGADLRPGNTVLVQGTGGVSLFALQLARAAGANVILTSSSPEKRRRAEGLGAVATLDYRAEPHWGRAVRTLTQGEGVDIVVEVGGPGTFDQSITAARYGGTVSLLGVLTGFSGAVDTYAIFHKALHIAGIYVGSRAMFESLNAALATARIHPVIDSVHGFAEARGAYEHLASGAHFGKVVIAI